MRQPLFAGIDPAIGNTGIVVLNQAGEIVKVFNSKFRKVRTRKDVAYHYLLRLDEIAGFVIAGIEACMPDTDTRVYIGYEDYSLGSENRAFTTGELGGVLRLCLVKRFGHLHLVEPTVLKKFATGHGQAGKDQMMRRARIESPAIAKLSNRQQTSDVCDAYHLAKYVWYRCAPECVVRHETKRDMLRMRLELSQRSSETDGRSVATKRKKGNSVDRGSRNQVFARG